MTLALRLTARPQQRRTWSLLPADPLLTGPPRAPCEHALAGWSQTQRCGSAVEGRPSRAMLSGRRLVGPACRCRSMWLCAADIAAPQASRPTGLAPSRRTATPRWCPVRPQSRPRMAPGRAWGMLQAIRAALPGTHVVLQGVLPRGATLAGRDMFTWPNRFTAAIAALNAQYEACPCCRQRAQPLFHVGWCAVEDRVWPRRWRPAVMHRAGPQEMLKRGCRSCTLLSVNVVMTSGNTGLNVTRTYAILRFILGLMPDIAALFGGRPNDPLHGLRGALCQPGWCWHRQGMLKRKATLPTAPDTVTTLFRSGCTASQ
jgi:hypothetical protein